jgi:hypothetical protein
VNMTIQEIEAERIKSEAGKVLGWRDIIYG